MGKKGGGRVRVKQVGPQMPKNPLAGLSQGLEEIKLPPKPDRSISYPWPRQDYSVLQDCSNFHTIYPSYLDSTKTIKRGRRIAATDAAPGPTVTEIGEALQSLNLRHVIEPYRGYPRDFDSRCDNPGRVLVDLNKRDIELDVDDDDGDGLDLTWNKLALIREVAKRVPSMPSRIRRLEAEKAEKAAKAKAGAGNKSGGGGGGGGGSGGGSGGNAGGGTVSSKKKKGKKKR